MGVYLCIALDTRRATRGSRSRETEMAHRFGLWQVVGYLSSKDGLYLCRSDYYYLYLALLQ